MIALLLTALVLANEAKVTGTLEATGPCAEGLTEVWFSADQTLLYQAQVPTGGTFEFHAIPGEYTVIATSSGGCFGEKKVILKDGAHQKIALVAERPRKPASVKGPMKGDDK